MNLKATNIFLCLRPNIYGHKNEHITLEYFPKDSTVESIYPSINKWQQTFKLPVTVKVTGYANWDSGQSYHSVALVEFNEYPELSWSKNWHITLESSRWPIKAISFDRDADAFRYDVCDRLWLGYKDEKGERQFIEAEKFYTLVEEFASE